MSPHQVYVRQPLLCPSSACCGANSHALFAACLLLLAGLTKTLSVEVGRHDRSKHTVFFLVLPIDGVLTHSREKMFWKLLGAMR